MPNTRATFKKPGSGEFEQLFCNVPDTEMPRTPFSIRVHHTYIDMGECDIIQNATHVGIIEKDSRAKLAWRLAAEAVNA